MTVILCVLATAVSFALWQTIDRVLLENQLIESMLAILLAGAAALHLLRVRSAPVPTAVGIFLG